MTNARAIEAATKLTQAGGWLDFGPERSRLLLNVVRALAEGRPVSQERVTEIAAQVGVADGEVRQFMQEVAEQDASGNIVGIVPGLSLNEHPHRFYLNGVRMSTWCAEDTLVLPAVLNQSATVESASPVSGEKVRCTVSPQRVEEARPPGAVVSIVNVEPERADTSSAEAIWGTFCHHIFFFVSRAEAEQWAAGRKDIEILSLDEAFELGRLISGRLLAHE